MIEKEENIDFENIVKNSSSLYEKQEHKSFIDIKNLIDFENNKDEEFIFLEQSEEKLSLHGGIKSNKNEDKTWEKLENTKDSDGSTYQVFQNFQGESSIKIFIEKNIHVEDI